MILLIGYRTEKTFRRFEEYIASQTSDYEVLDLCLLMTVGHIYFRQSPNELFIEMGEQKFWFSQYSAFFSRGYGTDLGNTDRNIAITNLLSAIGAYLQACDQTVVNRSSASSSNFNKLVHLLQLKRYGFNTPETIICGSPEMARLIIDGSGKWVSKSCSGIRTKVVMVDDSLIANLDRLSACPTLFQQRITGADVRIHVVGDCLLSEKIVSHRIDYRYGDTDLPPNEYADCQPPQKIVDACLAYCNDQGQLFAGIDFKISDEDGQWYILEANPMPGYESYDRRQNGRISRALYQLLIGQPRVPFVSDERRTKLSPF